MDLQSLLTSIGNTRSNPPDSATYTWYPTAAESDRSQPHYVNKDVKLGIDFQVSKLPFEALQVMDARLVTIAPGSCNEKHRHSHEAIFVLLSGQGKSSSITKRCRLNWVALPLYPAGLCTSAATPLAKRH